MQTMSEEAIALLSRDEADTLLSDIRNNIVGQVIMALRVAEIHGTSELRELSEETWALDIMTALGDPDFAPSRHVKHTLATIRARLQGKPVFECGACGLRTTGDKFSPGCPQCGHLTSIGPITPEEREILQQASNLGR